MINRQQGHNKSSGGQLENILDRIKYQLSKFGYYIRLNGRKLIASLSANLKKRRKIASQKIKRIGKERVYRLKGYTTVAKINRKRHAERQQRFLRKFLFLIIAFLILILMFTLYNPFKDLSELYRIIGIKDFSDLTQTIDLDEQRVTTVKPTEDSEIIINTNETSDVLVE